MAIYGQTPRATPTGLLAQFEKVRQAAARSTDPLMREQAPYLTMTIPTSQVQGTLSIRDFPTRDTLLALAADEDGIYRHDWPAYGLPTDLGTTRAMAQLVLDGVLHVLSNGISSGSPVVRQRPDLVECGTAKLLVHVARFDGTQALVQITTQDEGPYSVRVPVSLLS